MSLNRLKASGQGASVGSTGANASNTRRTASPSYSDNRGVARNTAPPDDNSVALANTPLPRTASTPPQGPGKVVK